MRDVCNQLKVVLQLIFSLGFFGCLVATFGLLLLNLFFCARHQAFVLAGKLLGLVLLQDAELVLVVVNVFDDSFVNLINNLQVFLLSILFKALTHTQLSFKFIYFLSVLLFIFYVSLCAPGNLSLLFFVFFLRLFNFLLQKEVLVMPSRLLYVIEIILADCFC